MCISEVHVCRSKKFWTTRTFSVVLNYLLSVLQCIIAQPNCKKCADQPRWRNRWVLRKITSKLLFNNLNNYCFILTLILLKPVLCIYNYFQAVCWSSVNTEKRVFLQNGTLGVATLVQTVLQNGSHPYHATLTHHYGKQKQLWIPAQPQQQFSFSASFPRERRISQCVCSGRFVATCPALPPNDKSAPQVGIFRSQSALEIALVAVEVFTLWNATTACVSLRSL